MPFLPTPRIVVTRHARERYCQRIGPAEHWDIVDRVKAARPARGKTLRQFRLRRSKEHRAVNCQIRADENAVYVLNKGEDGRLRLVTVLSRASVLAGKRQGGAA
jgi:hypothetical protein